MKLSHKPVLIGSLAVFAMVFAFSTIAPKAASAATCSVNPANLIVNGDFETPVIVNPYTKNLWQVYGGVSVPGYYDAQPSIPGWLPATYQVELQRTGLF